MKRMSKVLPVHYEKPYHWNMSAFFAYMHEYQVVLAKGELKPDYKILDLGCGDGKLTSLLAPYVRQVVGMDISEDGLNHANRLVGYANADFVLFDGRSFPFPNDKFDVITCFDVIEHIPANDLPEYLHCARACLKPGGLFIVTTPNRDELRGRLFGHKIGAHHFQEYTLSELIDCLKQAGLRTVKQTGIYLIPPLPLWDYTLNILLPISILLIKAGKFLPNLSYKLFLIARKDLGLA